MESGNIAVILNPASGNGKTLRLLPKVNDALERLGRPYHIHLTKGPDDATAAARRMAEDGATVVLAVGGDGTINEVVNGIVASGTRVPIGLVPAGSGSDLARTVGSSNNVGDAIRAACGATARAIDIGRMTLADGTSRCFVNVAGLGFDAIVAERVARSRLPGANPPYLVAALQTLATYRNIRVRVEADGHVVESKSVFVMVANGQFFGGGFKIAPMADLADGLLDLAVIADFGKMELLRMIPKVYGGNHVGHAKFVHMRARSITVETVEPARVQLDGELLGPTPVTFTVEPGALMLAG